MSPLLAGLAVAASPQQSPDAYDRFVEYLNAAQTLSVHIEFRRQGVDAPGHADLTIVRPDKLRFEVKWGTEDYTYSVVDGHAVEVDRSTKTYDEYPVRQGLPCPQATASSWVTALFPEIFTSKENRPPASGIDDAGRITTYAIVSGDPAVKTDFTFSEYKVNEAVADSAFALAAPLGYRSVTTARFPPAWQIGEQLPMGLLAKTGSNEPVDILQSMSGKPAVIAVLSPDCPPGLASIPMLKAIKNAQVLVFNVDVKGKDIQTAPMPTYYDPKGEMYNLVRAPLTPLFYLVDGKGKILNLWYGFDRTKPEALAKQIETAVASIN
ncbi:MAG: AhpC/TSA family [Fimbriimonadaceae bacterium]|jgi:hypothetical protein|nr:AhpC/TSA family [Fimbriimonadaceae bacterium]